MTITWKTKIGKFHIHWKVTAKWLIGNLLPKVLIMNFKSSYIAIIGYRCRAKPIKNPRMKNICFHGKKYIQIGYSKIQSRMGSRTNSNGTNSKCPHVLWGKQNLSSISNPPLISLRNGFPFSSYILLNMPIIYPCTNIPEKTIFY